MRFRWIIHTCVFIGFSCRAAFAVDEANIAAPPPPKTQSQVLKALEISQMAAENGMQQLSLRAVREAFSGGRPITDVGAVSTNATNSRLIRNQVGQRVAVGSGFTGVQVPTPRPVKNTIFHQALKQLDSEWRKNSFAEIEVYKALKDVVIPPGTTTVEFYGADFTDNAAAEFPNLSFSAARLLIEWAGRANMNDSLNDTLEALKQNSTTRVRATLLQCLLFEATGNTKTLRLQLIQLKRSLVENSTGLEAQLAAQVAFPLLQDKRFLAQAADVAELVIDQLIVGNSKSKNNHLEPATSLLKVIAQAYVRAGNRAKIRETVARILEVNSVFNKRYSNPHNQYVQRLRQAQVSTAVAIFVDAGMFEDAAPLIAEYHTLKAKTGRSYGTEYGLNGFRQLMAMPAEERFRIARLLCIQKDGRVFLQSISVSAVTPPSEFADAVKSESQKFVLPTVGPFDDVATVAKLLVDSAREVGELDALQKELQSPAMSSQPNAQVILFFALLASDAPDFERLSKIVSERTNAIWGLSNQSADLISHVSTLHDYVIAAQAIVVPELRDSAVLLLAKLSEVANRFNSLATLDSHIRRLRLFDQAVQNHLNPNILNTTGLKHWHSVECATDKSVSHWHLQSSWVVQAGCVKNLYSSQDGLLYFRYPLVGNFSVSAIVTDSPAKEGRFVYDGVGCQSVGRIKSAVALHPAREERRNKKVELTPPDQQYTGYELQIANKQSTFRVNRHVALSEKLSSGSPFLALRASTALSPEFHTLSIGGDPKIPRQVKLLSDHRMRGWCPYRSAETLPSPFKAADQRRYSWMVDDGKLIAFKNQTKASPESLLYYQRPLFDKESIEWEFRYLATQQQVHPALGRIAFLLHSDGVKLHWVTEGANEWSGLETDNALVDKAAQQSLKLPLKENDWNAAKLSLSNGNVQIRLNGKLVFERAHNFEAGSQFGFFRDARTDDVEVRNVVLSGDWPETYEDAVRGGLFEWNEHSSNGRKRYLLSQPASNSYLDRAGYNLARETESLPAEERFARLAAWVFVSDRPNRFCVSGGLIIKDTSERLATVANTETPSRQTRLFVSPALDLIAAAAEAGKLQQLREMVVESSHNQNALADQLCQQTLLAAIDSAQNDFDSANKRFAELANRIPDLNSALSQAALSQAACPLLVAGWNAVQFSETIDQGVKILDRLAVLALNDSLSELHTLRIAGTLAGEAHYRRDIQRGIGRPLPQNSKWWAVELMNASASSDGAVSSRWTLLSDGGFKHYGRRTEDLLYYHKPLRGDFKVEFEVESELAQPPSILYADRWLGPTASFKRYQHGRSGYMSKQVDIAQQIAKDGDTYRLSLEVRDGAISYWVNETRIHQEPLPPYPDPWLAIRFSPNPQSANTIIRGLKVSGQPTIPQKIEMAKLSNLHGWTARHFGQSVRNAGADWLRAGNFIIGANRSIHSLSRKESLLQYHRPMLEDGQFEYSFNHSKGLVHPAIGRTAFLLTPEGVKEHTITNGVFGQNEIRPENSQVILTNQIQQKLNFIDGTNQLVLTLTGNIVTLKLNGDDIYRRTLNKKDNRMFGFFHYPGKAGAVVSDVVYRGKWN